MSSIIVRKKLTKSLYCELHSEFSFRISLPKLETFWHRACPNDPKRRVRVWRKARGRVLNNNQVLEGALSNLIAVLTNKTNRMGSEKPAVHVLMSDFLHDLLTMPRPSSKPVKD
jgi:hypothetical protein